MKKNTNTTDKSAPYRTHSLGRISAPNKPKDEPKGAKISTNGDLRGKA